MRNGLVCLDSPPGGDAPWRPVLAEGKVHVGAVFSRFRYPQEKNVNELEAVDILMAERQPPTPRRRFVLDIEMPGLGGIDVLRRLKSDEEQR